jgi:hypothetical protein
MRNAHGRVAHSTRPLLNTEAVIAGRHPSVSINGASAWVWYVIALTLIFRWDYVVRHRVQLPDEYDEIFEDLEPFWGIDPHELARTQQELEMHDLIVTVQKTDTHSRLEVIHSTLPQERQQLQTGIHNIIALVREVEHELPPLRITVSPFDNPDMLSDWYIKTIALEAAANGTSTSTQ